MNVYNILRLIKPKSIYESVEWQNLDLSVRYSLVPTIEGIRPAAKVTLLKSRRENALLGISGVDFETKLKSLEYCLKKAHLHFEQKEFEHGAKFCVAKSNLLLLEFNAGKIGMGEFLGYPDCCAKAFKAYVRQALNGCNDIGQVLYWQQAILAIENRSYNEVLDYVIHVPCRIDCQKSISMAEKIMAVLKKYDPVAAEYLKQSNRESMTL